MAKCILAILGPSGCGKTDARERLSERDSRFRVVRAFTTRALRPGESDRINVSDAAFDASLNNGDLLAVRNIFGARYGTPRAAIEAVIASGNYPLLDWPIRCLEELKTQFGQAVFSVYLRPTSIDELAWRLTKDGRDPTGSRLEAAIEEIEYIEKHKLWGAMDLVLSSQRGNQESIVNEIYQHFFKSHT